MENISTNSFSVLDAERSRYKATVKVFKSGKIALTGFAISQFLEGFELIVKESLHAQKTDVLLSLKLSKAIAACVQLEKAIVEIDYEELVILRSWLEARMAHCEKERDSRTTMPNSEILKFNPDTYIGQKLLLLDIRELMLGEIVKE